MTEQITLRRRREAAAAAAPFSVIDTDGSVTAGTHTVPVGMRTAGDLIVVMQAFFGATIPALLSGYANIEGISGNSLGTRVQWRVIPAAWDGVIPASSAGNGSTSARVMRGVTQAAVAGAGALAGEGTTWAYRAVTGLSPARRLVRVMTCPQNQAIPVPANPAASGDAANPDAIPVPPQTPGVLWCDSGGEVAAWSPANKAVSFAYRHEHVIAVW